MTVKAGKGRSRRSISSTKRRRVKKRVLLSRVTFQEVLLIRICIVNIGQDGS